MIDAHSDDIRKKRTKAENKKILEDKIKELEEKLSTLSGMLSEKPKKTIPTISELGRHYPDPAILHQRVIGGVGGFNENSGTVRISGVDSYDKRDLLRIAEENYQKTLEKRRGSLPKGFGSIGSVYDVIMSYDGKYARFLFKTKRCLGCKKTLDKAHFILCHDCANEPTDMQLQQLIRKFTRWGLYKKPLLANLAIKLRLAKVVSEGKIDRVKK